MLDRLIELLVQFIGLFQFAAVIDPYQKAVVLRLGKHHRTLEPGFHFIAPFNVDVVLADNVTPRTHAIAPQNLTTRDGLTISIGVIVTSSISDIEKALLTVEGVDDVLADCVSGTVGAMVESASWEEIQNADFAKQVTHKCRLQADRYGVKIHRVQFAHKAKTRSYHLTGSRFSE
jgi:regulator of protease activity HflC (stomatin/prohibitin superfamily)